MTLSSVRLFAFSAAVAVTTASAWAADAVLPQVPGAVDKASKGGYTSAAASVEGSTGSALEPYLITFLLPVFGLIAFLVARYVDGFMRKSLATTDTAVRKR